MHLACITNQTNIVKAFLEAGKSDVAVKDRNGNTAVHLAVKHGELEMLHFILNHITRSGSLEKTIHVANLQGNSCYF